VKGKAASKNLPSEKKKHKNYSDDDDDDDIVDDDDDGDDIMDKDYSDDGTAIKVVKEKRKKKPTTFGGLVIDDMLFIVTGSFAGWLVDCLRFCWLLHCFCFVSRFFVCLIDCLFILEVEVDKKMCFLPVEFQNTIGMMPEGDKIAIAASNWVSMEFLRETNALTAERRAEKKVEKINKFNILQATKVAVMKGNNYMFTLTLADFKMLYCRY
jgi:hypothetical protein